MTEGPAIMARKTAKPVADTVEISRAEYDRLVAAAEDAEDLAAVARGRAGLNAYFPLAVVDRILAGDNKLRVYREHRGLTLEALAGAVGTSKGNLSHIETGRRTGTAGLLKACARALDVPLDNLVDDE